MARLSDESHLPLGVDSSNEILSPQPCLPPGKEHLLATFETSHVPPSDNGSATDGSRIYSQDYEYNSSSSSNRQSTSDIFSHEMDEDLEHLKSRASSRSSISSMPASVLIHPINHMDSMSSGNLHEKMVGYSIEESEASFGGFDDPPRNMRSIRPREAAFRKPSSVRAIQMHTEDEGEDDEYLTPTRRRAGMRSPGSLPVKRSPYYSPNTLTNKPKPKKDYPLVLLHCNLLAPSLPVPGASDLQNQDIVEQVLPHQYWKRWRRLQEKVGSGVLRDRGVLISHPEDLYDMLEERLLESLELQRPRVHQGHFFGHEENNPESEGEVSDQSESETDGEQGEECLDCGGRVVRQTDTNRKWEIRVFAANGLMRAGAWAAAWREMEKVDVEVGLWLPSNVRRALEKRILEERAAVPKEEPQAILAICEAGHRDMDARRLSASIERHARSFSEAGSIPSAAPPAPHVPEPTPDISHKEPEPEIALGTLLINYIRVLASDKRNIALVIMSIAVAFLAMGARPQQLHQVPALQFFFQNMESFSFPTTADVVSPSSSIPSVSIESLNMAPSSVASIVAFDRPTQVETLPTLRVTGTLEVSESIEAFPVEETALPMETMETSMENIVNAITAPSPSPKTEIDIFEEQAEPMEEHKNEYPSHIDAVGELRGFDSSKDATEDATETELPGAAEATLVVSLEEDKNTIPLPTEPEEQLEQPHPTEEITDGSYETDTPEIEEQSSIVSSGETENEVPLITDAPEQLIEEEITSEVAIEDTILEAPQEVIDE
ncbi:hypothetical protein N7466_001244 [Penicillium verhagenii]|uniref:uncharacterized protein n=1 Tax=Penicillium verhagenii TaxID=1562060 RepID=UPI002544F92F|nr:uncharacterized protein N7466_001244 [Penicillium verhagenii]KAJ5948229.1 hypothetical protein N7466_001244 [Penicillium verhagenii]